MNSKYLDDTRKELWEKFNNLGRYCECECINHGHAGIHNILVKGKAYPHWKPNIPHLLPTTYNVMLVCRSCHEKIISSIS